MAKANENPTKIKQQITKEKKKNKQRPLKNDDVEKPIKTYRKKSISDILKELLNQNTKKVIAMVGTYIIILGLSIGTPILINNSLKISQVQVKQE